MSLETTAQDQLPLFPAKKLRFFVSLRFSLILFPILYFLSIININPFTFFFASLLGERPSPTEILVVGVMIGLFFSFLLLISLFLSFKNIAHQNSIRLLYRIPLFYFLVSLPIVLFYFYIIVWGYFTGGESGGFGALFAISYLWGVIKSLLAVIFLSPIVVLWLQDKKYIASVLGGIAYVILPVFIFTQYFVGGCLNTDSLCIAQRAAATNNQQLCQKASTPGNCFAKLAFQITNPNPALCENITVKNSHRSDAFRNAYRKDCYTAIAIKSTDPSICEEIKDKRLQTTCFVLIYENLMKLALASKDISYCEKISDGVEKLVQSTSLEGRVSRHKCFAKVAANTDNPLLCDRLKANQEGVEISQKELCYQEYENLTGR